MCPRFRRGFPPACWSGDPTFARPKDRDRKSTRLNSSHLVISYAVFCLKKKKKDIRPGDVLFIPPGRVARVVGADPFVQVGFPGMATYAHIAFSAEPSITA